MAKLLTGKVISLKMNNTVVVEVTRRVPHKLYGKLIRKSRKFKVDPGEHMLEVGSSVVIAEIKPMSKEKYFKIIEVQKIGGAK